MVYILRKGLKLNKCILAIFLCSTIKWLNLGRILQPALATKNYVIMLSTHRGFLVSFGTKICRGLFVLRGLQIWEFHFPVWKDCAVSSVHHFATCFKKKGNNELLKMLWKDLELFSTFWNKEWKKVWMFWKYPLSFLLTLSSSENIAFYTCFNLLYLCQSRGVFMVTKWYGHQVMCSHILMAIHAVGEIFIFFSVVWDNGKG